MRKNCLIKVSGDVLEDKYFPLWLGPISMKYHVVICVGGGKQINKAFEDAGYKVVEFGPLGRETKTLKERQLARDVLEINQAKMQDWLTKHDLNVSVEIPVISSGTVLCHVNGDQYILSAYNGFDKIYVITTKDRVKAKKKAFKKYSKIEVVGF